MNKTHKLEEIVQKLCENCALKTLCRPDGLNERELAELNTVIRQSRRLKKGEYLFHAHSQFTSIFAVRTGFVKTLVAGPDGRDQVTGFFMSGEVFGLGGICNNVHNCDAVALEDSEVCELPIENLEKAVQSFPFLQAHFYRLMSQEIVRGQGQLLTLGNMRAEERLAIFLINLSGRLRIRGFAANDFILRMSREEIGSYLGLKLETVSRIFSRFQHEGWVKVDHKHIRLIQPQALQALILHECHHVCFHKK